METSEYSTTSIPGCLLRSFWLMGGNCILFVCAMLTALHPAPFLSFSVADTVFGATVASLILARYLDIRHLKGATASGEPATARDLRRYGAILAGGALGLWLIAHLISSLQA